MKQFTFRSIAPLGDYDDTYGQAYWAEVNEQLQPVMFNSKDRNVTVDDRISADEILVKEGKKGEFHRLRKIKIDKASGSSQPAQPTVSAGTDEVLTLLRENNKMLKQLTGAEPVTEPEAPKEDSVYPVDGEPISLENIPF